MGCSAGGFQLCFGSYYADNWSQNIIKKKQTHDLFLFYSCYTVSYHNCTGFTVNVIEATQVKKIIEFHHAILFVCTAELNVIISSITSPTSLVGSL